MGKTIMAEAAKPWEKYAASSASEGPWTQYQQPKQQSSFGVKAGIALPEAAAQLVSGAIAEPVAGLVGLASTIVPGAPPAGDVVRNVRRSMTYQPRSPEGQQMLPNAVQRVAGAIPEPIKAGGAAVGDWYKQLEGYVADTYGPAAGAALATLPTALLEAIPAGLAIKKTRDAATPAPAQFAPQPAAQQAAPTPPEAPIPTQQEYQQIASDLRAGNTSRVVPQVQPDDQILKDAEALGISLNPSHYSTNRAYIDMEQALKSRPGSQLARVEEKAIIDLGNRADDLIESLAGSADKSALDMQLFDDFNETIGGLENQSNQLYTKVNETIPRATRITPNTAKAYIDTQIADFGGDKSLLSAAEKEIWRVIGGDTPPTYAAVDRLRRDVGAALNKKSGPFKDAEEGQLKKLYSVLSEDQMNAADAFGMGDILRDANALIVQRKKIEESAVSLFGREAQSSIVPKLRQAAGSLTQGDISKLSKVMASVPEPYRQQVAATLLNDLFASGARRSAPIGQGFVNAFQGLNRNAGAKKELFKYLPEGSEERFNAIGRVATGIYRAKQLENTSKSARDIISAMDDGGMFGKMYGIGKQLAAAEGVSSAIGFPGAGAVGVLVGNIVSKGATPATKAADELLTSPAFKEAVIEAAVGNGAKQAKLVNTPEYNAWLATQNPSIRKEIAAMGFVPWLTSSSEKQTEGQGR
jgi:hypothetical protein